MIRHLVVLFCCLIAADALCGTKIYEVYAPEEIPTGDDFIVAVTCAPLDKGNERVIVIEHPSQCSLKTVYAVSPKDPTELLPLSTESEVQGMFHRERSRSVVAFKDESGVIAGEANVIVYYFVFSTSEDISVAAFKCALVERNDPLYKPEPVKDKKGKKKAKPINPNWRMANPPRGSDFRFSSFPDNLQTDVEFVKGWEDNSRALQLKGKESSATLHIVNDSLGSLLWQAFSISFWYRSIEPFQEIFSIIRGDDTLGAHLDAFSQVTLESRSEDEVHTIAQSPYYSDGSWHHCLVSKDSNSLWRLFIDGELVAKERFVYLANNPKTEMVLGSRRGANDIQIDELCIRLYATERESEIRPMMAVSTRDTLPNTYAIFHFEELGRTPRSSVYEEETDTTGRKRLRPITIKLDTNATLVSSNSPVLYDEVFLSFEQPSVSKLNFDWRSSREYDVQAYQLERRIETFGDFQKVLRIPAKKFIAKNDSDAFVLGRSIYSASEKLPKISKDIELYYRLGLISSDSSIRYTNPMKIEYGDAKDIFLEQNKPNPFSSKTTISYTLKKQAWITLKVYDIIGREVMKLVDEKTDAGKHTLELDASNWLPGIYFYKAKIGKQTVTKRMLIIK